MKIEISPRVSVGILLFSALILGTPAKAEEVTLKAASAFALGTDVADPFERFVKRVNEQGKGLVQIDLVGGPDAIPPFQQGNAVQSGVLDMTAAPGVFYTNVVPEGEALKLTTATAQQMRANGTLDLINEIWNKKGLYFLARTWEGIPFNIYLKKPLKGNSFKGVRLRTTPNYRTFFAALGATNVETTPGEVYTALERGVVDGMGWMSTGLFELGWNEHVKYRVEPAFYAAELDIVINLKKWQTLTQAQQDFLTEQAVWYESLNAEQAAYLKKELQRQTDAGIQPIVLEGAEAEEYLKKAYDAGWEAIRAQSPENADRLRAQFDKR